MKLIFSTVLILGTALFSDLDALPAAAFNEGANVEGPVSEG